MIQRLIARFGGTPALIFKLVFLGLVNAMTIWALPTLISTQSWPMLAVLVIATLALDFILLTKRLIPAKYVVIGAIFLTTFQLIPIAYNISIAFTNYSTGNIGTKPEAVEAIIRDSAKESENSTSYDMLPARNAAGELVLILTPQVAAGGSTDETAPITTEPSPSANPNDTEFGGESAAASTDPNTVEFGGECCGVDGSEHGGVRR